MRPFRFRLEVALDLRRREDADAQRARSVAFLTLQAAEADMRAADTSLHDAMTRAAEEQTRGSDGTALAWHRNWIARWRIVTSERRSVVVERQAALQAADAKAREARRRFKSLDRLRERAWDAYVAERRRIEQQDMDAFGVMRHVFRTRMDPREDGVDDRHRREEPSGK